MTKSNGVPTTSYLVKLVFSLFAFLVVLAQGVNLFTSGVYDRNGNLVFHGDVLFHDSNVHLSLIAELQNRFPPTNFTYTLEGVKALKNYHYIYDVLLLTVSRLTHVSSLDLYYRFAPIAISLLLCVTIYLTTLRLTSNKLASAFAIFFTVFATSFGSLSPFIKAALQANPVNGASNMFMTDQLLDILVNPHGGLILVLFLALFLLLWEYERTKKIICLAVFAVALGLSFGIKAYGGIIFVPATLLASLWFAVKSRDFRPAVATVLGLMLMTLWVVNTIDPGVAGLRFAPGWLLEKMMIELDRFNEPRFILLLQHYQATGNWLRIVILEIAAFLIYSIGSLGLRILGLIPLFSYFKKVKSLSASQIFLFFAAVISFVVPPLFNQSKKAYDIVQFTPYFTLFMGIMFTVAIFRWRPKPLILALLLLFFLWSDRNEILNRFVNLTTNPEEIVLSKGLLESTKFIADSTPQNSIILLAPTSFNINKPWFPALTGRQTVYCCRGFAFQVGVDTDKAEATLNDIFTGRQKFAGFDYVFLTRPEELQFAKIKELYQLVPVFENQAAVVLKRT